MKHDFRLHNVYEFDSCRIDDPVKIIANWKFIAFVTKVEMYFIHYKILSFVLYRRKIRIICNAF